MEKARRLYCVQLLLTLSKSRRIDFSRAVSEAFLSSPAEFFKIQSRGNSSGRSLG
jgi:hypothetical protein